jgi:hypothetical protein
VTILMLERTKGPVAAPAGIPAAPFHPCPIDADCPFCAGRAASPDWSFAELVVCISLREREDRLREAAAEFHRTGLCRRVLFYRPTRHPTSTRTGIWESHRAVALEALARGARTALVFEDDVLFVRDPDARRLRRLAACVRALPPDWTILYLGHLPLKGWLVAPRLMRAFSGCAHAYLASERALRFLAAHPYGAAKPPMLRLAGGGIDAAFAALPQAFAWFPMLAIQRAGRSDNMTWRPDRRMRRLKHLFTRTRHREWMLSAGMRPAEIVVACLSPLFWSLDRLGRGLRALRGLRASRRGVAADPGCVSRSG